MDAETDHGLAVTEQTVGEVVDIAGIMQAIPHRYPFLLIDRVVDMIKNVSAIGIKNIESPEQLWPVLDQLGDLQTCEADAGCRALNQDRLARLEAAGGHDRVVHGAECDRKAGGLERVNVADDAPSPNRMPMADFR